ncbi:MAG: M48 family metallopeptidase [Gammaproteobacteria bacterium]
MPSLCRTAAALALLSALTMPSSQASAQRLLDGPAAAAARSSSAGADDDRGVALGPRSRALAFAPAKEIEQQAGVEYSRLLKQAAAQRALAPPGNEQLKRLRGIAERLIPQAAQFNERAARWRWEVNLIGSPQVNAFCMPGGKIAFFTGIIDKLKLTDDEIAMVMGHEMAHALREHGRERVGKARLAQGLTFGASILSQLLGFGNVGGHLASGAAQLTMLKFSRDDEREADLAGMELTARAGFDPRAAVVLWEKMARASRAGPPQWLSTHPSHDSRIAEIRRNLAVTLPLYARTQDKSAQALPPYRTSAPGSTAR